MLDLNSKKLYLASKSPRRAQLLKLIGLPFEVIDSHYDESDETYTIPEVQVMELAQKKAVKVAENIKEGLIVGADTVVVLENDILGKPAHADEALKMLLQLSGRTHTVYTGFALVDKPSEMMHSDFQRTRVTFRKIHQHEIEHYIKTDNPLDKAGAYGIQDKSAIFVEKIDGCFYNVVGFPLTKFYLSLSAFLNKIY
ncbi:MAG: Maf family protein [bacterium]